jgi:NTP pyrophosphatase (non-canonical NTP hydrolase)
MNLEDLQDSVDEWIRSRADYWGKFEILARLVEEPGDVAATLQHSEDLRSGAGAASLSDELGDLLLSIAAFANVNGIHLSECIVPAFERRHTKENVDW